MSWQGWDVVRSTASQAMRAAAFGWLAVASALCSTIKESLRASVGIDLVQLTLGPVGLEAKKTCFPNFGNFCTGRAGNNDISCVKAKETVGHVWRTTAESHLDRHLNSAYPKLGNIGIADFWNEGLETCGKS